MFCFFNLHIIYYVLHSAVRSHFHDNFIQQQIITAQYKEKCYPS